MLKNIEKILVFILFLACIVFPFDFYIIKLPILLYFILKSIVNVIINKGLNVSTSVFFLFMIYIFSGLFFIIYGIYIEFAYPKSFKYVFSLYVLFPVIYFTLLSGLPQKKENVFFADTILTIGIILTSLVIITAYLNKKHGYFDFLSFIYERLIVDLSDNVVKINYHGISSLLFLFPFYFTKIITDSKKYSLRLFLIRLFILFISAYAIFLTGRRALLVLFFISIFITFIFIILYFKVNLVINRNILFFLFIVFILSFPILLKVDFVKKYNTAKEVIAYAFNSDGNISSKESDNERVKQIKEFINEIPERPFLGYGHGASLQNVIRSADKPWRYEMSYFDIVFHTGFLGLLIYITGPIWILFSLINIANKNKMYRSYALSYFNAFFIILIAFFTNPYLNAFDIQWVIYLPLYFILTINNTENLHSF